MTIFINYPSEDYERLVDEELYYRDNKIEFQFPFRVQEIPPDPSTVLSSRVRVRQSNYRQRHCSLDELEPDHCRFFCLKDVAIYMNAAPPPEIHNGLNFFYAIYRHFFPHRDINLDLEQTHFFNTFIDIISGAMLSDVARFHEALCQKVESLVPESKAQNSRFPECFKLAETYTRVFIVADTPSANASVLLVCRDEETAQWLNLKDEQREHDPNAGSAGRTEEHPSAAWPLRYRMGLIQAMEAIFSIDEERRIGVVPDSPFYKCDILGEDSYQMRDIRSEMNGAVNGK